MPTKHNRARDVRGDKCRGPVRTKKGKRKMNSNMNSGTQQSGQGGTGSGSSRSNRQMVPEARQALNNMKMEIANEFGVDYNQGDKGNLTSRQNGSVGGEMTRRLVRQAEQSMSQGGN